MFVQESIVYKQYAVTPETIGVLTPLAVIVSAD
jgi:hypothetical protein